MKNKLTLFATALLAASATLTSCKEEVVAKKYAQLNVIQASPDAPGLNTLLDSTKMNSYVLQFGASTGYQQVEDGKRLFKVNTFRGDVADTLVVKTELVLKQNEHFSVFIIDSFSKLNTLYLPDNLSSPPNGKAYVRFINLVPNSDTINIAKSWDSSVVFAKMTFKDATGFTELNAGVYDLDVRKADTTNKIIASLPTMTFNTGKIYTFYIRGYKGVVGKQAITSSLLINKY